MWDDSACFSSGYAPITRLCSGSRCLQSNIYENQPLKILQMVTMNLVLCPGREERCRPLPNTQRYCSLAGSKIADTAAHAVEASSLPAEGVKQASCTLRNHRLIGNTCGEEHCEDLLYAALKVLL